MIGSPLTFLMYGIMLVLIFAVIIIYNYSRKNKDKIEQAKYNMLDDEDEA